MYEISEEVANDSILKKGVKVCYKDVYGNYSRMGYIDGVYKKEGHKLFTINNAIGAYLSKELKTIQ